jgi:hypothetical protein
MTTGGTMRTVIAVLAVSIVLAACSNGGGKKTPATPAAPVTVHGTVLVVGHNTERADKFGGVCWTGGNIVPNILAAKTPFDDVKAGAQVVVTDSKGATLGIGRLGPGVALKPVSGDEASDCRFPFTVASVKSGGAFYGVKVAGQDAVQFAGGKLPTAQVTLGP